MSCDIEPADGGTRVYRVARLPDPWAFADWRYAWPDGTFGGRYDDPLAEYRVLYACSSRVGAFMETLAGFRPQPAVLAGLAEIASQESASGTGRVPRRWLEGRTIGAATLPEAPFAQIAHSRSLGFLRERLAERIAAHGLDDLDAAAVRLRAPRRLTQEISRLVFDCAEADGAAQFAGIRYGSRLGDELENWALFERPGDEQALTERASRPIAPNDGDLLEALERLGLTLDRD